MIAEFKIWAFLAAVAVAAGFVAPLPEVIAGLAFATAGGWLAMAFLPPEKRVDRWGTLGLSLLIGALSGVVHSSVPVINILPVQFVMGIGGIASRFLMMRWVNGDFTMPWSKKGTSK